MATRRKNALLKWSAIVCVCALRSRNTSRSRKPAPKSPRPLQAAGKGSRPVYFEATHAQTAQIYERGLLDIGAAVPGPAIVEQFDATTVIPEGWSGTVDFSSNLVLEKQ
jgi:N-methylhydantoinase A/oxoprolinase/acetone carboxylase beta subunit